ncbi:di-heme oxidoredictase family protein, partial [Vibrio sp. 10N.222.54.F6]
LLHDGRARNVMEAVLWHGGEAEMAKQKVLSLNATEREALLAFLNSL